VQTRPIPPILVPLYPAAVVVAVVVVVVVPPGGAVSPGDFGLPRNASSKAPLNPFTMSAMTLSPFFKITHTNRSADTMIKSTATLPPGVLSALRNAWKRPIGGAAESVDQRRGK